MGIPDREITAIGAVRNSQAAAATVLLSTRIFAVTTHVNVWKSWHHRSAAQWLVWLRTDSRLARAPPSPLRARGVLVGPSLGCLRFARAASLLVLRLAARRRWEELIHYPYLLPVANVISASWFRTSRSCPRTLVLPDGQEAVPYLPRVCRLRWRSARCQMGFAFVMAFRSAYGSLLRARRWWVLCRWFPLASANCYIVVSIVLVWKRKAPMRANNCSAKFFVFGWRIARSRWLPKTTKNSCSGLRRLSWAWTRIAPGR